MSTLIQDEMTTRAQAGAPVSVSEAAVEVLASALSGLTVGASDAGADAGSTATKAIFVQGGTGGLAVATKVADGVNVTFGAKADAKSSATDTTAVSAMSVWKQISASVQAMVLSAGTAIIGKVGIDQSTPGVTNATQLKQYTGVPSNFALASADQTVFTLASGEIGYIQNLSADAPLAVKKGASASTTSLSFILPKCTGASDGTSAPVKIDDWIGAVSVAKMTGTASYIAYKVAA